MRTRLLLILALALGCNARPLDSDCDGVCEPAGPAFPGVGTCQDGVCTPTYTDCVTIDEVATCAEACAAQGRTCASNACGGQTYRLYAVLDWCEDPERTGGEIEGDCDAPIQWQFNSAAKCCCTQE